RSPLFLAGNIKMAAALIESSLSQASRPTEVKFQISAKIQGAILQGETPLTTLEIAKASPSKDGENLFALESAIGSGIEMPANSWFGESVLLPRSFRDGGALVGDTGYISYYSPTPSTVQEQRVPIFVAGFYDPGII